MAQFDQTIDVIDGVLVPLDIAADAALIFEEHRIVRLEGLADFSAHDNIELEGNYTAQQLRALHEVAQLLPE